MPGQLDTAIIAAVVSAAVTALGWLVSRWIEQSLETRRRLDFKLHELQKLLNKWRLVLWTYVVVLIVGAAFIGHKFLSAGSMPDKNILALYGAVIAGAVALFGHLFSKYADFRRQYIEVEFGIKAEREIVWKRLIAFHAEISENLITLAEGYSKEGRKNVIQLMLDDPNGNRFTRADTSNPIYEENRAHLYQFSGSVIRAITNYYHLEQDLNLAVEALLLDEYRALKPVQKLAWVALMLQLAELVVRAGAEALEPIAAEILKFEDEHKNSDGKGQANLKPDNEEHPSLKLSRKIIFPEYTDKDSLTWINVTDAELKPLRDRIKALENNPSHPPKRRKQAKKIKRSVK